VKNYETITPYYYNSPAVGADGNGKEAEAAGHSAY
jgi:hypothetical protein